jgi:hypothetical protein
VRSRLPDELWAMAAKLARRDGITATARPGQTESSEVDGSIGAACEEPAQPLSSASKLLPVFAKLVQQPWTTSESYGRSPRMAARPRGVGVAAEHVWDFQAVKGSQGVLPITGTSRSNK